MDTNSKTLTFKEHTVLEQVRQHHKDTVDAFNTLDDKAKSAISISSIVITIIVGFQLLNKGLSKENLYLIGVLYSLTLVCAFVAIFPRKIHHQPIKHHWNDMRDALRDDDDDFFYKLIGGYALSIEQNREINDNKAWFVKGAFICLGITVMVTLFIASSL